MTGYATRPKGNGGSCKRVLISPLAEAGQELWIAPRQSFLVLVHLSVQVMNGNHLFVNNYDSGFSFSVVSTC